MVHCRCLGRERSKRRQRLDTAVLALLTVLRELYPQETHIAFELFAQDGKTQHTKVSFTYKLAA